MSTESEGADPLTNQVPADLQMAIAECLKRSGLDRIPLPGTSSLEAQDEALGHLARELCAELVRYCAYRNVQGPRVDPFDDPYVGAALVTEDGRLLGSHRKERRHETHAEMTAILQSLTTVGSKDAADIRARIQEGFETKVWLRGDGARTAFRDLFSHAGRIVKEWANVPLIFLSTLEPCRDFETQPACSVLLTAFCPDVVLYACDDTNEKGQGREVLAHFGLKVLPNLAIQENLDVNQLFYAAVHYLDELIEKRSWSSFGLRYAIGDLDALAPEPVVDEGHNRLRLRFEDAARLPIYEAVIEPRVHFKAVPPGRDAIDPHRILFLNQLNVAWMASYLEKYRLEVGVFPGIIVCSDGRDSVAKGSRDHQYLQEIEELGVRVYTDVLRRRTELALGAHTIDRWRALESDLSLVGN